MSYSEPVDTIRLINSQVISADSGQSSQGCTEYVVKHRACAQLLSVVSWHAWLKAERLQLLGDLHYAIIT